MRFIGAAVLCLLLRGSVLYAEQPADNFPVPMPECRITVKTVGSFMDSHNHPRAIYLFHDKNTNRDFFGIDGMGISPALN